ncbi:metallophosphoesterase [Geomonas sp. RF6]|uniref:metallophosphoesterase family protein n=1 Tax=Geomonas sp. RF6 TaxID=2897342 RepID=UPI001E571D4C|nr:metallophosphoesterase [Geomonas sp. RF6]UFS70854.1 metallophosphoesterase [Geomonas sp. RF6]
MRSTVPRLLRQFLIILLLTVASSQSCLGATLFDHSLSLFQAKAQKVSPADYTFVVLGDSRDNEPVFRKALAVAASYDPLFIVHGGDYSSRGGSAETEDFLSLLRETVPDLPVFVVPGNHETRSVFTQKVGPLRFTLDSERLGLTFVAVDNSDYVLRKGEVEYLRAAVNAARGSAYVMMHVPPKTERWNWHTFSDGADDLKKILALGKVQAAFFSHVHLYDRHSYGGVPSYITGGGGAPLVLFGFPGDPVFHILVVRVQGGKGTVTKVELPDAEQTEPPPRKQAK